jgi:hypothetical protein
MRRDRILVIGWVTACTLMLIAALTMDRADDGLPAVQAAQPAAPCSNPPQLAPSFGADIPSVPNQDNFDCYAWQEFIALNWPAAPNRPGVPDPGKGPQDLGAPGDLTPVVWETYATADQVVASTTPPAAWGSDALRRLRLQPRPLRRINRLSSKDLDPALRWESIRQAFPPHAWLTGQNQGVVYSDIRINPDEYAAIVKHRWYDAGQQYLDSKNGKGVHLPYGRLVGGKNMSVDPIGNMQTPGVGALELKAAWVDLTNRPDLWKYYKTSPYWVEDPSSPVPPKRATLGLVGLHVIHKTFSQLGWVWATFEHVDNCPNVAGTPLRPYLFYDPSNPQKPNIWNDNPSPPYHQPSQVARVTPLSALSTGPSNNYVSQLYRQARPDSVWQNYRLVEVLWFINGNLNQTAPQTIILKPGTDQPPMTYVANSTLETYIQKSTCTFCHAAAPTAPAPKHGYNPTPGSLGQYAADFSFVLSMAPER